ncbi:nuclear transport factor 2 family protein [Actinoplanes sp. NBC_00393]|uniref:nuclear transport factor 2 family protein n=1 Tax=Actinoplanes sp. NBC_00393 TaxID=2975953 RepID=UPI002E24AD11
MTVRPGSDFLSTAQAILRHERDRLTVLLSCPYDLVLVGGSSLPGALTKGDVDLHLRIPPADFAAVVTTLRSVYQVVHPEIWQATLATFSVEAALPTGVAVTPAGSEHDVRFTRTWERMAADPALVQTYNDIKLRHLGDPDEYERQKSAFFDSLLKDDSPRSVAYAFNDCINDRDLAGLSALMTDDHTFVDAAGAAITGKAACAEAWRSFFAAFPDYRNEFVTVNVDGGTVTVTGYSTCSEPALAGPARWTATVVDGRVSRWQVTDG